MKNIQFKLFVSLFFILFNFGQSFSQIKIIELETVTVHDGLSNNHVNSIVEDAMGYIWIGTQSGLNIYDGNSTENIYSSVSDTTTLSKSDISCLTKLDNGNIIAGTWGEGLNSIHPISKKVHRFPLRKSTHKNIIRHVIEDKDKDLWIATFSGGVYKYVTSKNQYIDVTLDESILDSNAFSVTHQVIEVENRIWVTSWKYGLAYIDKHTLKLHYAKDEKGEKLEVVDFTGVIKHNGSLILSTEGGRVYTYDLKTFEFKLLESFVVNPGEKNRITTITIDANNSLWVVTREGLYQYDFDKKEKTIIYAGVNGVKHKHNLCSYIDSENVLWLGTANYGLNRYDPKSLIFSKLQLSGYDPVNVNTICPLSESVLLLGTSTGIVLFDIDQKTTKKLVTNSGDKHGVVNSEVEAICPYKDGYIIGADVGYVYMDKSFNCSLFDTDDKYGFETTSINSIHNYGSETWVCGRSNGLLIIKDNDSIVHVSTSVHAEYELPVNNIYCSEELDENRVLIGTELGVLVYDRTIKKFSPYLTKEQLNGANFHSIHSIKSDEDGTVWFGTHLGLVKYTIATEDLVLYTIEHGLPNTDIQSITLEDDMVWATTKLGLFSLNIETEKVHPFSIRDGLLSNTFYNGEMYKSQDSILYMGNGNGMSILNLKKHPDIISRAHIEIRDFYLKYKLVTKENSSFDEHITFLDEITVSHKNNDISFRISPIDYSTHYHNQYGYKLEGYNEDFIYKEYTQTIIEYTNLPPGEYELIITAVNQLKEPIGKARRLKVNISAPFWKTMWFKSLMIGLIILCIYGISTIRIASVKESNAMLEKRVALRTKDLDLTNKKLNKAITDLKEQNKLIESNISYASLIQQSLSPQENDLKNSYADAFVLYKPKDVVSGDFLWHAVVGDHIITVVADCTGHGVSGAFMSMLGISLLNFIIKEQGITKPDEVLMKLDEEFEKTFRQDDITLNDRMDITVFSYESKKQKLYISGAMSKAVVVNYEKVSFFKGDRFPIGGNEEIYKGHKKFTLCEFEAQAGTRAYFYTDGFQDQFHHETGKKYSVNKLRDVLLENRELSFDQQQKKLSEEFLNWKGDGYQVDDILIMGIEL